MMEWHTHTGEGGGGGGGGGENNNNNNKQDAELVLAATLQQQQQHAPCCLSGERKGAPGNSRIGNSMANMRNEGYWQWKLA